MKKARRGWIPVQERLPEMQEVYKGGPKTSAPVLFFDSVRGEVTLGRYEEHSDRARGTGWGDDTQPDWANVQHRVKGDAAQRLADRLRAQKRGGNGTRKLSIEQVAQIRAQREAGDGPSAIARRFGISRQQVWNIVSGWQWKKSC